MQCWLLGQDATQEKTTVKKLLLVPAGLVAAFAAQFAFAQGMAAMTFAGLDTDTDGEISAEELAAAPPVANGFVEADTIMTAWDADGNGSISEEEFNNRPQGMGGMGMGG